MSLTLEDQSHLFCLEVAFLGALLLELSDCGGECGFDAELLATCLSHVDSYLRVLLYHFYIYSY